MLRYLQFAPNAVAVPIRIPLPPALGPEPGRNVENSTSLVSEVESLLYRSKRQSYYNSGGSGSFITDLELDAKTEDSDDTSEERFVDQRDFGPWDQWPPLSECSRPCGGGVAIQQRLCRGYGQYGFKHIFIAIRRISYMHTTWRTFKRFVM